MADPLLTIGMATYDDPQGVWWTLSSLRLHHLGPHDSRVELLVIDDHPRENKDLVNACANAGARLVRQSKNLGPALGEAKGLPAAVGRIGAWFHQAPLQQAGERAADVHWRHAHDVGQVVTRQFAFSAHRQDHAQVQIGRAHV